MQIIDTHGHLNFVAFDEDRGEVINRIKEQGMKVVMPSSQFASSKQAVELATENNFLYAAIGIHPIHVFDEEFDKEKFQKLVDTGKVTAVGEVGMDYYHLKHPDKPFTELKSKQTELFKNFIKLAQDNSLPLIVHGRFSEQYPDAYKDIFQILQETKQKEAVIHCYTGNPDDAKVFTGAGYKLGITGIVTFDKSGILEQVVRQTPLNQLLIETDSPYLSPVPYRGKRNEPIYVIEVARKIAEIKQISLEDVVNQTTQNALNHFKI